LVIHIPFHVFGCLDGVDRAVIALHDWRLGRRRAAEQKAKRENSESEAHGSNSFVESEWLFHTVNISHIACAIRSILKFRANKKSGFRGREKKGFRVQWNGKPG
jgi:hypothetical protein